LTRTGSGAKVTTPLRASALLVSLLSGCRATNISSAHSLDPGSGSGGGVASLTMSGVPGAFNMFADFRGVSVDHKSSVPVSDLRARDLPLRHTKHPNISPDKVVVAILLE
jgi:hypothetical protein